MVYQRVLFNSNQKIWNKCVLFVVKFICYIIKIINKLNLYYWKISFLYCPINKITYIKTLKYLNTSHHLTAGFHLNLKCEWVKREPTNRENLETEFRRLQK